MGGLFQNVLESGDGGVFVNLRDGSGTNLTSTNVGGKQGLDVNIINSMVMIGVPDESAFTYGTSDYQPVGGVYNGTITQLTTGQGGAFSVTPFRDLRVNLRNNSGTELAATNTNGLWVKPGDGTNAQSYASTGEAFCTLRQGGNVANINSSNELLVLDGAASSILGLMTPQTGTPTSVPMVSTAGGVQLLAANPSRKGFSIQNDTTKTLYIAMASSASATAYTVRAYANGFYEQLGSRVYQGVIFGIGPSGVSGSAVITEYT